MRRFLTLSLLPALVFAFLPASIAHAAPTATVTMVEAPNQFGVNAVMPLRIQVTAVSGSDAPTGSVTLFNNAGQQLQRIPLRPAIGGGLSSVIVNWWTFDLGLNKLRAVYTPDNANFTASQSTFAGIFITESTPLAVLRMPDRFVVGTQANLTVLINPANGGGSATFNVNNRQVRPSTPNNQGQIAFPWTPETSTQYTFVINYTNRDGTDARQIRQPTFAFPTP
jgi:hypothetical protein